MSSLKDRLNSELYKKLEEKVVEGVAMLDNQSPEENMKEVEQARREAREQAAIEDDDEEDISDDDEEDFQNADLKVVVEDTEESTGFTDVNASMQKAMSLSRDEAEQRKEASVNDVENLVKEAFKDMEKMPRGYGNPAENIPATPQDVAMEMKDYETKSNIDQSTKIDWLTGQLMATQEQLQKAYNAMLSYVNRKSTERAYEETEQEEQKANNMAFAKTSVQINDELKKYTLVHEVLTPNEKQELISCFREKDASYNFNVLRGFITSQILQKYTKDRINSIYVVDQELIINDMAYVPDLGLTRAEMQKYLPLDVEPLIAEKRYAQFFLWHMLKRLPNVTVLCFTDLTFVTRVIKPDLEIKGEMGVVSFFKLIKSLESLTLGNETFTPETINSKDAENTKQKFARAKRGESLDKGVFKHGLFEKLTDGITKPTELTSVLQDATGKKLSDFWHEKDKGVIKGVLGTAALSSLFLGSWALNTGTHLFRNIGRAIFDSTKSLKDEDLMQ